MPEMKPKSFYKHLVITVLLVRYNSWRVYIWQLGRLCSTCVAELLLFFVSDALQFIYRCSLFQLMGRTKLKGCVVCILWLYAYYYLWWYMKGIVYLQSISTWGILLMQTQQRDACLVLCTFQEILGSMRCSYHLD